MFRTLLCLSSGGQLYQYSIWYRHCLWVTVHYTGYERMEFNTFIILLYMFRALLCSSSGGQLFSTLATGGLSPPVTSVLNSHPKTVTIPDAVLMQLNS